VTILCNTSRSWSTTFTKIWQHATHCSLSALVSTNAAQTENKSFSFANIFLGLTLLFLYQHQA
jgi:hypothetical protein